MIFQMFSVFDLKGKIFLAPFVSRSAVDAKRQIAASLADPNIMQTPVGQHPEDFALYRVGDFDDEYGKMNGSDLPELICHLPELKASPSTVPS